MFRFGWFWKYELRSDKFERICVLWLEESLLQRWKHLDLQKEDSNESEYSTSISKAIVISRLFAPPAPSSEHMSGFVIECTP